MGYDNIQVNTQSLEVLLRTYQQSQNLTSDLFYDIKHNIQITNQRIDELNYKAQDLLRDAKAVHNKYEDDYEEALEELNKCRSRQEDAPHTNCSSDEQLVQIARQELQEAEKNLRLVQRFAEKVRNERNNITYILQNLEQKLLKPSIAIENSNNRGVNFLSDLLLYLNSRENLTSMISTDSTPFSETKDSRAYNASLNEQEDIEKERRIEQLAELDKVNQPQFTTSVGTQNNIPESVNPAIASAIIDPFQPVFIAYAAGGYVVSLITKAVNELKKNTIELLPIQGIDPFPQPIKLLPIQGIDPFPQPVDIDTEIKELREGNIISVPFYRNYKLEREDVGMIRSSFSMFDGQVVLKLGDIRANNKGQGYGSSMMVDLELMARQSGATMIYGSFSPDDGKDRDLERFYDRLGFTRTKWKNDGKTPKDGDVIFKNLLDEQRHQKWTYKIMPKE